MKAFAKWSIGPHVGNLGTSIQAQIAESATDKADADRSSWVLFRAPPPRSYWAYLRTEASVCSDGRSLGFPCLEVMAGGLARSGISGEMKWKGTRQADFPFVKYCVHLVARSNARQAPRLLPQQSPSMPIPSLP
jgi:hypothetical protein